MAGQEKCLYIENRVFTFAKTRRKIIPCIHRSDFKKKSKVLSFYYAPRRDPYNFLFAMLGVDEIGIWGDDLWTWEKAIRKELIYLFDTLTPREEKILKLRFGIGDGRLRTLEEVGREFNLTKERIRQIEARALRKMRHPSRAKHLKKWFFVDDDKYTLFREPRREYLRICLADHVDFSSSALYWSPKRNGETEFEMIEFLDDLDDDFTETVSNAPTIVDDDMSWLREKILELSIDDLDFGVDTYFPLINANIKEVRDLVSMTEDDLLNVPGIGSLSCKEITEKLTMMGLSLKE